MDLNTAIAATAALDEDQRVLLARYLLSGILPVAPVPCTITFDEDLNVTVTLADGRVAKPLSTEFGLGRCHWEINTMAVDYDIDGQDKVVSAYDDELEVPVSVWYAEVDGTKVPVILPEDWRERLY